MTHAVPAALLPHLAAMKAKKDADEAYRANVCQWPHQNEASWAAYREHIKPFEAAEREAKEGRPPVEHVLTMVKGELHVNGEQIRYIPAYDHETETHEWPELTQPKGKEEIGAALYDAYQVEGPGEAWKHGDTFAWKEGEPVYRCESFHVLDV